MSDIYTVATEKIKLLEVLLAIESDAIKKLYARQDDDSLYEVPHLIDAKIFETKFISSMIEDTIKIAQKIKNEIHKQTKIQDKFMKDMRRIEQ